MKSSILPLSYEVNLFIFEMRFTDFFAFLSVLSIPLIFQVVPFITCIYIGVTHAAYGFV